METSLKIIVWDAVRFGALVFKAKDGVPISHTIKGHVFIQEMSIFHSYINHFLLKGIWSWVPFIYTLPIGLENKKK